jgi:glycosyltransferase involved in cell wall biosynthesis
VASADFVVLAELLRHGVQLDLFAHRAHVPRPAGLVGSGFRYFGFDQPAWLDAVDRMPGATGVGIRQLLAPLIQAYWRRTLEPAVEVEHLRQPYDAVLTLGTTPAFALRGVPNVTWLQSPFHTELEATRRLREQIISVSGRSFYALLVTYYRYRGLVRRHTEIASERLILPSTWSRDSMIAEGAPAETTHALPYAVDLETFCPEPEAQIDWDRPMVLSLGRLDPRKRLDLLLDAFAILRETFPGIRLRIVGRAGYAPNHLSLLEHFRHRDAVQYLQPVPREQVPPLLRQAAAIVQTSENENFGSAVAEALACGTPVVVGSSNGTASYIDHNSRVFDSYTPESVAAAVLSTLEARRERPRDVRRSTRAAAERWFAAPTVAGRLLEIIEEAITAADGARGDA